MDENVEVGVSWRDDGGVGQELSGLVKLVVGVSTTVVGGVSVFFVWFRWIFLDSASIVRCWGLADAAADVAASDDGTGEGGSTWLSQPSTSDDGEDEDEDA